MDNSSNQIPQKEMISFPDSTKPPKKKIGRVFRIILMTIGIVILFYVFTALYSYGTFEARYIILPPYVFKVDYYDMGQSIEFELVEEANWLTFRCVSVGKSCYYTKDKNYVFSNGDILNGADPKTFKSIVGTPFYRDKSNVFWGDYKFENADPETFKKLFNNYYIDKNNIYFGIYKIKEVDVSTFEKIDYHKIDNFEDIYPFSKDKNFFYYKGIKIDTADSLEILNDFYLKNKESVYYWGDTVIYWNKKGDVVPTKISTADVATFKISPIKTWFDGELANDKNSVYISGQEIKIDGIDTASFQWLGNMYGKDKNRVYHYYISGSGAERNLDVVPNENPATFVVPDK